MRGFHNARLRPTWGRLYDDRHRDLSMLDVCLGVVSGQWTAAARRPRLRENKKSLFVIWGRVRTWMSLTLRL